MRILIAYDGTHGADEALDDLARAGLPSDTEATVLSVADASMCFASRAFAMADAAVAGPRLRDRRQEPATGVEFAREVAAGATVRIRSRFPGWRVSSDVGGGAPASSIVLKAAAYRPDLVIVGRRGSATSASLLLGSVARRVLAETQCSIRIGRAQPAAEGGPVRILVCHDGSGSGTAALLAAVARPWPAGSEVRVVAVDDADDGSDFRTAPRSETRSAPDIAFHHEDLREALDDDVARAQRPGLTVWAEVTSGVPAGVLLRTARRWNAHSVFVGSTSRSRASRTLLGSVSLSVAERASSSVEVVRGRAMR